MLLAFPGYYHSGQASDERLIRALSTEHRRAVSVAPEADVPCGGGARTTALDSGEASLQSSTGAAASVLAQLQDYRELEIEREILLSVSQEGDGRTHEGAASPQLAEVVETQPTLSHMAGATAGCEREEEVAPDVFGQGDKSRQDEPTQKDRAVERMGGEEKGGDEVDKTAEDDVEAAELQPDAKHAPMVALVQASSAAGAGTDTRRHAEKGRRALHGATGGGEGGRVYGELVNGAWSGERVDSRHNLKIEQLETQNKMLQELVTALNTFQLGHVAAELGDLAAELTKSGGGGGRGERRWRRGGGARAGKRQRRIQAREMSRFAESDDWRAPIFLIQLAATARQLPAWCVCAL